MLYKVGDRVRVIKGSTTGSTGTVVHLRRGKDTPYPYGLLLDKPTSLRLADEKWMLPYPKELRDIANDNYLEPLPLPPNTLRYIIELEIKKLLSRSDSH